MCLCLQDDTLIIQTRKVQYQCMSKLSAKELANRGHMFLANGDKRKSAVIAQQQKDAAPVHVNGK